MARKQLLKGLSAGLMVASVLASLPVVANAATGSSYIYYNTVIYANGQQISQPKHIATKDPFGGPNAATTSFLPFYYVDQALGDMGIKTTWDGTHGILNLQVPAGTKVNYPANVTPVEITSGTMAIQINGRAVTFAPRIAYFDAGTTIETSFIPVYYLQKALGYAGIQANWNGTDWTMVSQSQTSTGTGAATKLQAALAFAQALGIKGDPSGQNPYSDVSSAQWPVIHALTEDYKFDLGYGMTEDTGSAIFAPDSSSKFGSNDPLTTTQIDYAYMISRGIKPNQTQFLPNGSAEGLANSVGLNDGLPSSGDLSSADLQRMVTNLSALNRGYSDLGNGKIQLLYQPSPTLVDSGSKIPVSTYQNDVAQVIKEVDETTVTFGSSVYTSIPGLSDAGYDTTNGNYFVVNGGGVLNDYSLDGGKTWHAASDAYGYSSLDVQNGGTSTPPSTVLLRSSSGSALEYGVLYDGSWYTLAMETASKGTDGTIVVQYK
ncbi:hypothetical protein [Alicyclobacillus fodiniaquatilis]|uniref:Copper amine oxidase-like N-terminal domain-containing protein n=1 Tax=Alicyclobacillus fodiniaquatilis TaxID=1661150 RepID=A0ABW4JIE8_9BACL